MDGNSETLNLVREAGVGNRQSMEKLLEVTRPRLFAYLMRLTMDYHLAEDLLQDVQTEIVTSLWRLNKAHLFWPWIYKHAWGKARHHYRDTRRQKTVYLSEVEENFFDDQRRLAAKHQSITNDAENEKLFETIYAAMKRITLKQRNILTMRCFEDMSFHDISEFLDCSETSARVSFFRARHKLKKHLRRKGYSANRMFVPAIGMFGALTSKITAAGTSTSASVASSSVELGFAYNLLGFLTTKLGILCSGAVSALLASVTLANLLLVGIITAILIPVIFTFLLYMVFEE